MLGGVQARRGCGVLIARSGRITQARTVGRRLKRCAGSTPAASHQKRRWKRHLFCFSVLRFVMFARFGKLAWKAGLGRADTRGMEAIASPLLPVRLSADLGAEGVKRRGRDTHGRGRP